MPEPDNGPAGQRLLAGGKLIYDQPGERVHRLTLNNPTKRNALDHQLLDGLSALLGELEALPPLEVGCLILRGAGGVFCAGYDIGGIERDDYATRAERLVAHPFTEAIDRLERFPAPTLGALEGPVLGGGLELALACDLRVAAAGARLGMPPAKLGLVYSHRGLARFVECIGAPRTRELFLRGAPIDAATAERWGLVNQLAPAEQLEGRTLELAGELAAGAPLAQRGNKRVLAELVEAGRRLDPRLEQELLALRRRSFESEDLREGMAAFFERRSPRWQGR